MDNNTLLLLGQVKLKNPKTGEERIVKSRGFSLFGFIFPQIRWLTGGFLFLGILSCFTFLFQPVWAWYTAFNYYEKSMLKLLSEGWVVVNNSSEKEHRNAA